ncbi:MAG: RHS repeat-associated core domain-containing protein, partial [Dysgonomonas sp.]|nr:RHS repeat-associated core domain-containing protein [Dysgonomonas sp.]
QPYKYNGKELDEMHGVNMYDYSARYKDEWRFTTMDPHAENYYSWSPYAYVMNNPLKYIDPTGMDSVPSNEVWETSLINYRTEGGGIHEDGYYPVVQDGKIVYRLHKITSGENEGNYYAVRVYGQDEDGNEMYSYDYVVGADKVDDFRNGEMEGSGYLRGFVKLAVESGVDGKNSFWKNASTHLDKQYTLLNLLFTLGPRDPRTMPLHFKRGSQQLKAPYSATSTIAKPQNNWIRFLQETKGTYSVRNQGTYRNMIKTRSADYQVWKNNNK